MKKESKRSTFMRVAGGMMVVSMLATCVISGTMAKYTSSASGSDTARAAKWSIDVNGTNIATADTFTLDLFSTVGDEGNPYEDDVDVKNGDNENIVAPGTGGVFDIAITNDSEVTADFDLKLTEVNESNIPIRYSFDENGLYYYTFDELENMVATSYDGDWGAMLSVLSEGAFDINSITNGGTVTIPCSWIWAYDGVYYGGQTDESDTAIGNAANTVNQTVSLTATVTATQVD